MPPASKLAWGVKGCDTRTIPPLVLPSRRLRVQRDTRCGKRDPTAQARESDRADVKHKVFWVKGCETPVTPRPPPTTPHATPPASPPASPPAPPATAPEFTIAAGDPANVVDPGVTGTEFVNTCKAPPASQDADGHVTTLTGESGEGAHAISVKGAGVGTWGLDMYFYNSTCQLLGLVATSAADETGVIPSNTKYVVTHLFLGAALPVTLAITDTQ